MARLVTSGFELGGLNNGGSSSPDGAAVTAAGSSPWSIVSSGQRSGGFAARYLTGATGANRGHWDFAYTAPALGADIFIRFYFNVQVAGSGNSTLAQIPLGTGSALALGYDATNNQLFWDDGTFGNTSPNGSAPTGTWCRVDIRLRIGSGAIDETESYLNGTIFGGGVITGKAFTDTPPSLFCVGSDASNASPVGANQTVANMDILYDDVAINNASGGSQNSYPGDGQIVLLKPTADSAVGTGWTLGTGTAISGNTGKTAVSNTPPLGVTDLAAGSDPKQIRNASSNANVNYDATMTTYTAAGVGSSDTVNVVQCWVATAAPLVTSAKAGTVGIVSNPAVTNIALAAGGTAGAFWSGVAGGTYPAGWKWSPGTSTIAPTVTKGTAPVMRITQVTASTRIAVVCGMFVYVDYTPTAATAVIPDVGMALTVT